MNLEGVMKKNRQRAFTLIELAVGIALITIVITISANSIQLMSQAHELTFNEYELQSAIKQTSSQLSDTIRYSQAVFAVPISYVEDTAKLDPEWDYITLSPDSRSVIKYSYDTATSRHITEVLVEPQDNVEYEIVFEKQSATQQVVNGSTVILNDNVLFFSVIAYLTEINEDGDLIRTDQKITFQSEVKAVNALQVVDKGTLLSPAVALAYRQDDKTYGEGRSHVIKVSLILDTSGSMAWIPGVDNDYPGTGESSRLTFLKKALIGNGLDGNSGIIAQFAALPNFEISIVPFANRASYILNSSNNLPFFNASLEKSEIVTKVNALTANGSTNTGDGIRLSLYNMLSFDTTGYNENVEEHDFTIILVDGDSNYYSWVNRSGTIYYHRWNDTTYNVDSGNGFTYVTRLGDTIRNEFAYTGDYYLIGYVTNPSSAGVANIKSALNIPDDQVFLYSDSNFNLSEVFANIATDIMAKSWLVTGPQIKD